MVFSRIMVFSRTRSIWQTAIALSAALILSFLLVSPPAWAVLTDDHFDGNIFPLYAGNGSLVPPRVSLVETLREHRPALLVFYADDSSDCKKYVSVVSQLDSFYGREANFIPVIIDAIPLQPSYAPTEAGYYYKGYLPQTVLLDQSGKVVLNAEGVLPFEQVDDAFRQVFNLLPRSESVELKRRPVNEVNTELTK
jgi:thiol-disulfide isomerase/thioredoxin